MCVCLICSCVLLYIFKPKNSVTNLIWVVDGITQVNEKTEKHINQILKEKGYDYKISFRCVDFFNDDKEDPVSKIENLKKEQVDILCIPVNKCDYSGHSVGLEMVNKNMLECLDGVFSNKKLKEMQKKGISMATTINGKHYGVYTGGICASKTWWYVDRNLLKKSSLKINSLKNKELWQIDQLLGDNKNASNVTMDVGDCDNMLLNLKYEFVTDYIGVRLDDGSCIVRNLLEDAYTLKYLNALHKLAMKGILTKENHENVSVYLLNEEYTCHESQEKNKEKIPAWKDYYSYNLTNMQQGVASWSKHKKEAEKVLEILFTDKDVQLYLNYGADYRSYTFDDGKVIDQNQKEKFNDGWSDFLVGDLFYLKGYTTKGILRSPAIGFTFDDSGFEDKLKQLQSIYDEAEKNYFYIFEKNYQKRIRQLQKKLKANGIIELQREIQKQLDSYNAS